MNETAGARENTRWELVKAIFNEAADNPPSERGAVVRRLALGDPELVAEVESLLEHSDTPLSTLDTPPIAPFVDVVPGTVIGAYCIEREIGRGGMGTVYLASRADGTYQRRVALKLIRRGIDTEHVLRRFHNERQILARLDHPNVARLLDGGATAEGRPYFVMEYVDGIAIDEYCEGRAMSIDERLRLFLQVCLAVHSAHQKLVVHRDLKPANILVTADGLPKLLDFGIARMLAPADETLTATVAERRMLTPEYASPEQLLGRPVGTSSDVYSLGVVLYELLTGVRPHHRPSGELPGRYVFHEPERPSTAAARRGNAEESERRRRRLRGDLDNVVLMALRVDEQRRYQSVLELANDIGRFLDQRPVLARADTFAYRTRKFLRRNWLPVTAAAVVIVSLLGGIAATARQARIARAERARAERRFTDVRQLTNTLLFDLHRDMQGLPGSIAPRQLLVKTALRYLDALHRDAGGDAALERDLAAAYQQVAGVAFDMAKARDGLLRALAIYEELVRSDANCDACRYGMTTTLLDLGDLLKIMGQTDAALLHAQRAREEAARLARSTPADRRYRLLLEQTQSLSGFILEDVGDHTVALANYREVLPLARALAAESPHDPLMQRRPVMALLHIGINLAGTGAPAAAAAHLREALTSAEALSAKNPLDVLLRRDVWNVRLNLGKVLLQQGQTPEALEMLQSALTIKEWLHRADPGDTGHQRGLAVTQLNAADALTAAGRNPEAVVRLEQARALSERLVAADPLNCESMIDLATIERRIGEELARRGDPAVASHLARAATLLRACRGGGRNLRVARELGRTADAKKRAVTAAR